MSLLPRLKRLLLGSPLRTTELHEQRLSKKAALAVARTEDDDWLHPEKLITTMSLSEAKVWQVRLRAMDEAHRIADRKLLLEGLS